MYVEGRKLLNSQSAMDLLPLPWLYAHIKLMKKKNLSPNKFLKKIIRMKIKYRRVKENYKIEFRIGKKQIMVHFWPLMFEFAFNFTSYDLKIMVIYVWFSFHVSHTIFFVNNLIIKYLSYLIISKNSICKILCYVEISFS